MNERAYLDFDLRIRRLNGGYSARVLNSPAGEAKVEFRLPFSELELENFLLRVGRPRQGVRRLESPEMEAARTIGGRLFEAVFDDEVLGCLRRSLDEATRQDLGLRIRLRLDAPELADIPWEYLYDPSLDRFLSLSKKTPIVRWLELPERIHPLPVDLPLRVLVMISCPSDVAPLDVEAEWAKLKEAVQALESQGLLRLERLEKATLAALQQRLRRGEYHIFHFVGHGAFDERSQDGVLLLESERGRGRPVSGRDLGTILHDHRSLRLALLNACEGARTSRSDPFAGVAHSLVQQGIPAVIAMQFEITDRAAITLAHGFYAALVDGYPVDAALAEARRSIFARESNVEWGTPVLYLRAPDARIFAVDRVSEQERQERQIATLLLAAQQAIASRDWAAAREKLQGILALDPAHTVAASRLKEIEKQEQLAALYARGLRHYYAGSWREAGEYLRKVHEIDADYRDVDALLAGIASRTAQRPAVGPAVGPAAGPAAKSRRWLWIAIPIVLVLLAIACGGGYLLLGTGPTPTPTDVAAIETEIPVVPPGSPTATPTATAEALPIPTDTDTPTPTATHTPSPTPTHTPSPKPAPAYVSVPLPATYLRPEAHSMAAEKFAYPLRGRQVFDGIPFDFVGQGSFIQTQFQDEDVPYSGVMPQEVSIPVGVNGARKVYVLMNLAYGCAYEAPRGSLVGEIAFYFDDGTSLSKSLVTGDNIREWSIGATHCSVVGSMRDPTVQEVWRDRRVGSSADTVIDMHLFEFPPERWTQQLTEIVIRDTSRTTSGHVNPAIIVFAITVVD